MSKGFFSLFTLLVFTFGSSLGYAQNPTPEQLQMFQSLPASQQQALAQQYGVNLPSASASASQPLPAVDIRSPRLEPIKQEPKEHEDSRKTELERFGLELFATSPSTFAPVSDVPIPSDYRIGSGDELVIQLFGKENMTHRLRVNREGVINFPSLGPISVAGLSFSEVRTSLTQRVQEQMIGVRSDITLGELRSMQIFVMGEAYKPGAYTVSALTNISQAIYYSGGFSKSGALRNIQLKRDGKVIAKLDMYDLLLKGDTSHDVRLMPGDVVWIAPVQSIVKVQGEVQRPAIYEIKTGETYRDIIELAGGLTVNAFAELVKLKRLEQNDLTSVINLDLTQPRDLNKLAKKGDTIEVTQRSNQLQNYIQLKGDVTHPGFLEWHAGLKVSDLFHSFDSSFRSSADVTYALVIREINLQRDIQVFQFSLADALLNPNGENNLRLQNRDQVIVFNRHGAESDKGVTEETIQSVEQAKQEAQEEKQAVSQQLATKVDGSKNSRQALLAPILLQLQKQAVYGQPAPIVDLVGEVRYPGRYPISQKQDWQSLLIAAGGLTANAYSERAELTHAAINSLNHKAIIESVNLTGVLNGVTPSTKVEPRDRLTIFERPNVRQQSSVVLQGEVKFPGNYTVLPGETLAQLLERAGGLTEFAHPQGAVFTREALRLQEQKLLTQYAADMRREVAKKTFNVDSQVSNVINDPDKTLTFIEEATKSRALGRMVVQLDQIIDGNTGANFMLEDGDFLFVPTYRNTVSIMGEVQVGITYLLDPSLTVKDYISKAGGMKKQADDDRIFVVRADGSVFKPNTGFWFGRKNQSLKPGDTIVVPVDTDYRDALNVWTAATQILYQTGVAVNALK